jgi:rare lipoprotein A
MFSSENTMADQQVAVQQASSGTASWYGAQHHGRRTASGERFDKNGMTAAHRSLPFGTKVRVTGVPVRRW